MSLHIKFLYEGDKNMKKTNKGRIAAVLAAMVMMTGCGNSTGNSASELKPESGNLVEAGNAEKSEVEYINRLDEGEEKEEDKEYAYYSDYKNMDKAALKIFGQSLTGNDDKNVLISPFSINMAMGLVENGADGNTLSEIEKVIGGGVSVQDMNRDLRYLSSNMEADQDVNWNVANSIWLNTGNNNTVNLKDSYINSINPYYDPMVVGLDFNDGAEDKINSWVNEQTHGMIPTIINETPKGRMALINAVAFEGEWDRPFSEDDIYEDFNFTNFDGTTSSITMLSGEGSTYYKFGDGDGFKVDYKGGQYSFVGILPPEGVELSDYVNSLIEEDVSLVDCMEYGSDQTLFYYMPEFKTEYSQEMSDTMKNLGMNDAFSETDADFSKLNDGNSLYISSIMHKTYINVNREGTEAAAATEVVMTEGCIMVEDQPSVITLDRPFMYMIVDNTTNMPIFMGAQNVMQ